MWDFDTIDTADSTDESGMFEMESMNEIRIGQHAHCSLRYIIKSVDDEEEPTIWYGQVSLWHRHRHVNCQIVSLNSDHDDTGC